MIYQYKSFDRETNEISEHVSDNIPDDHNGHLILYGAGDFINDYEEIPVREGYNTDGAMFIVDLDSDYKLRQLSTVPRIPLEVLGTGYTNTVYQRTV